MKDILLTADLSMHSNDAVPEMSDEAFFISETGRCKFDLYRVAYSILQNHADTEDALSKCIISAYTKLSSLRSRNSFKTWMIKILVRICYAMKREKKRFVYEEDMAGVPGIHVDTFPELFGTVNRLPDEFRVVIVLHYYEDMSVKKMASVLRIPQGTVKSRLSRAKEKLRAMMEHEGGLEHEPV